MTFISEKIEIPFSFEKSIPLINKALFLSEFIDVHYDKNLRIFYAETAVSLMSLNENIKVEVEVKKNKTELNFTSKSHDTVLYDWNKNNINRLLFIKNLNHLIAKNNL